MIIAEMVAKVLQGIGTVEEKVEVAGLEPAWAQIGSRPKFHTHPHRNATAYHRGVFRGIAGSSSAEEQS